jgi:3-phosphoshikimate 1-carboxyvinyltransferase
MENDTLKTTLTGSPRLKERPIKDLTDALTANGCSFTFLEKDGFFPFQVGGTFALINHKAERTSSVAAEELTNRCFVFVG